MDSKEEITPVKPTAKARKRRKRAPTLVAQTPVAETGPAVPLSVAPMVQSPEPPAAQTTGLAAIFDPRNRHLFLDVLVFVINLILLRIVTSLSTTLVDQAQEDRLAKLGIGLFFAAAFVLQPAGAILKRRAYHRRLHQEGDLAGCLFWMIFPSIALNLIIFTAALILISESLSSAQGGVLGETLEVLAVLGGVVFSVVEAIVVFRYFSPPKKAPRSKFLAKFLETPQSEWLGDTLVFLNVICFQILWVCITTAPGFWNFSSSRRPSPGIVGEFLGRLFIFGVVAIFLYFPPRLLYLAETWNRKRTWVIMLLSNSPILLRALFPQLFGN
jgi:hypothetical protein